MYSIALQPTDQAQFNALMRRSYRKVFNLAYRLSSDRADAEDLTQEAFYRAYRAFHEYEGHRPFENWIFRIVTRLFLDLKRARKRRVPTVSYDAPIRSETGDDAMQFETADTSPTPEGRVMGNELSEELEEALKRLPQEQRLLVWMADAEGTSYAELAASLGIPIGTIRSRLHRARKQLRSHIEAIRREKARKPRTGGVLAPAV